MQALFALLAAVTLAFAPVQAPLQRILGSSLKLSENMGVLERFRTDLQIQNSNGMVIPPEMGLRSKVTFVIEGRSCRVQGEICLQRGEFDPVIDGLRQGGLSITGLSSRFAGSDPAIYFIQFEGVGAQEAIAKTVKHAIAELGQDRQVNEGFNRTGNPPLVDWPAVSLALGTPLKQVGASAVRRAETKNAWVTFGGCPCGRTMVFGELTLSAEKLQHTIDEIRAKHISITGISKGSVDFETEGDAMRLAEALRKPFAEVTVQSGG